SNVPDAQHAIGVLIAAAGGKDGHANAVIRVAFTPDGKHILSASSRYQNADRVLRIWDVATGKEVRTIAVAEVERISSAAFSPDGKIALTDAAEPILRLWKLEK